MPDDHVGPTPPEPAVNGVLRGLPLPRDPTEKCPVCSAGLFVVDRVSLCWTCRTVTVGLTCVVCGRTARVPHVDGAPQCRWLALPGAGWCCSAACVRIAADALVVAGALAAEPDTG